MVRVSVGRLLSPWLLAVALLTGCAAAPPAPEGMPDAQTLPDAVPPGAATDAEPQAPPPRVSPDAATLALLQQSERAAESGSLDQALSYAERAVRIDPRRADLWTRLATLELRRGDPDTAIRYASKAVSLAAERPDWQREAWLVIADAREAQGDMASARTIRERWRTERG